MTRYVLSVLVGAHVVMHLISASKTIVSRAKQGGINVFRIAWIVAAIPLLLWACAILFMRYWWCFGFCSVLVSQILIAYCWGRTKWGTFTNVILCVACAVNFAGWQFHARACGEAEEMFLRVRAPLRQVSPGHLEKVSPIVRKWLVRSGVIGKPFALTVALKQKGLLRTAPGAAWMPVRAAQYFTVAVPAFLWCADIDAGFFYIAGKDRYAGTHGRMEIKAAYLLNVANSSGAETDQGTRLRYLAEIQWFPSAALSPYIKWTQTGPCTADAEMSCGNASVKGTFMFNDSGDITAFYANRYMEKDGRYSLERWYVPVTGYKVFDGIRVPSEGHTIWRLDDGDFNWFDWEIAELHYNSNNACASMWQECVVL